MNLTEKDIVDIYKSKKTNKQLAEIYQVEEIYISNIMFIFNTIIKCINEGFIKNR